MSTVRSKSEIPVQPQGEARKRGCLFYVKRGLKWFGSILVTLIVLGVVYQTIATELNKGKYIPRGQLYTVNGHQMHIVCMGEGSPAVILQAGGNAESTWWYWVQQQLAEHTRVCAFDRPGFGWSEPVAGSRDALSIDDELHELLEQAGIPAPYVMVGHSIGALWTRVYAGQYPQEIAGIVLVDHASVFAAEPFASQSEFEAWQTPRILLHIPVWVAYQTGLVRVIGTTPFLIAGYPAEVAQEMVVLQAPNRVFDASYAEAVPGMWGTVNATAAIKDLGDLPTMVLWASQGAMVGENARPIRDEIAALSSNEATRLIEGADHASILGNAQYAQQVSDAILDVIEAAETGEPLA